MSDSIDPRAVTGETAVSEPGGTGVTSGTGTVDQAAYDALRAELDAFKREVAKVAGRYAQTHNLCSMTDKALAELGLRRVQTGHRVSVTLTASWDVNATSPGPSRGPSEPEVWAMVELLIGAFRYSSVKKVMRVNATRDSGDFPRLEITSAEVSIVEREPGEHDHILPALHRCPSCESRVNPSDITIHGECPACGEVSADPR